MLTINQSGLKGPSLEILSKFTGHASIHSDKDRNQINCGSKAWLMFLSFKPIGNCIFPFPGPTNDSPLSGKNYLILRKHRFYRVPKGLGNFRAYNFSTRM